MKKHDLIITSDTKIAHSAGGINKSKVATWAYTAIVLGNSGDNIFGLPQWDYSEKEKARIIWLGEYQIY